MLSVYLATLGFGTVLIGISLMFGGADKDFDKDLDLDHDADHDFDHDADHDFDHDADHDFDHDADHDFDHDFDHDADHDFDHDHDVNHEFDGEAEEMDVQGVAEGGSEALWIPFLSMRFWSFGTATFGLTGTLLVLSSVPEAATAVMASVMGMGIGIGAARFFRALKKDTVTAETSLKSYAGEDARVLLPIRPGGTGKIVIESLAGRVEMPATSRDGKIIDRGATVIVASVRDGVADVSALPTMTDSQRERAARAKRAGQAVKQR